MEPLRRTPVGELSEIIQKFVRHKRSLGYKYLIEEDLLYRFSRFSLSYEMSDSIISKELIEDWVKHLPGETRRTQRIRSSCICVFLRFAADNGYQVVLPPKPKRTAQVYVPYIFTEIEIVRFFHTCDHMLPYPGTHKHIMVPVIFRLMYGCGIRVTEVSNLKCRDVDLDHGMLTIRESKFGKDRLVPMSESLREAVYQFGIGMNPSCKEDDFFFKSKNLKPISRHWVYRRFREVLRKCGIAHAGKGKGPRAHDLRHSFCVRTLKQLVDQGVDIYCALPILATYVGHASVKATQGYVRLTVDMFPELIEKISQECAYILPEVMGNETD
jgi:integrase/recombinase XerD